MSRVSAVVFDMYDTLVQQPDQGWKSGFQEIIRAQNLGVTPEKLWEEWSVGEAEFRSSRVMPGVTFRTYFEAWRDCFARAFGALQLDGDAHAASASFVKQISKRDAFPETIEALAAIQPRWRTAVLSNADDDYLLPNLDALGMKFERALSSEKARVYKPLPGLFTELLHDMGLSPQETAYVGDRQLEDVGGARGVGMHAVWINRRETALDPSLPVPACQIHSLLELPRVLQKLG